MGYSNIEDQTYWTAQSLADDASGEPIDVRNVACGSMAVAWSGASATDAVVKVQGSLDKTNWFDISGASVTIGAASGADDILLASTALLYPWIRAVVVDNTESTGTATLKYFFKGDR